MTIRNHTGEKPSDVILQYGKCIELISMDKHYNDISIGLYLKEKIFTIWSFYNSEGTENRIRQIRDQLIHLGGMVAVANTTNQVRFKCDHIHERPIQFLLTQAVSKLPDYSPPTKDLRIKDSKSDLEIIVGSNKTAELRSYSVNVAGEAKNPDMRLRMIIAGFVKYGEMEKISTTEIAFPCKEHHDGLIRVLLPYSRNISSVESMMATEELRGQMNTSTLGFSQV